MTLNDGLELWLSPWSCLRFLSPPSCEATAQIPQTDNWAVFRWGETGRWDPVGVGVQLHSCEHQWSGCLWDTVSLGASGSLTARPLKMTWMRTGKRSWGARSGGSLGGWEEDARGASRGEVVEVGPSGEVVVLGEACPVSWTCLVRTVVGAKWQEIA